MVSMIVCMCPSSCIEWSFESSSTANGSEASGSYEVHALDERLS